MAQPRRYTTKKAHAILVALAAKLGMPPTVEQYRRALRAGSKATAARCLDTLEADGLIRRWPAPRGASRPARGMSIQGWEQPKVEAG